jgi:hypothetical protein
MSHFAQIDENNIVVNVIACDNNDPNGDEGYQWLVNNIGGNWVKTSYNTYGGIHYLSDENRDENNQRIPSGEPHLRYNYAMIGGTYDSERDAFISIKPTEGDWHLNEETCLWEEITTPS